MKKITFLLVLCISSYILGMAQTPNGFKYQAVARSAGGDLIKNQVVGLRLSILKGSTSGNVVYIETHFPASSDLGVLSLNVGQGAVQSGSFSNINWGSDSYYLRVEMDATGGNNFQVLGTSQLLSVPYALHARTVDNRDDADANPSNELQTISKTGNVVTLSHNGGSFIDAVNDADADPTNELQQLTLNGNTLGISGGNSVVLPGGGGSSPWQPNGFGIEYYPGIVYANAYQAENEVRVGNNGPYSSFLNPGHVAVDYSNYDGTNASLSGNSLRINGSNPSAKHGLLSTDSLEMYRQGVGLLFNSRSVLSPDRLNLEFGTAQSILDAGSLWNTNGLNNSQLHPWALTIEEILSPSDIFNRVRLEPDSLSMWNQAKWMNVKLGTGPDGNTGRLSLYDGGGLRTIAEMGGNHPSFGGGFMELSYGDDSKAILDASFGNGSMYLKNKSGHFLYCATANDFQGGGYACVADTFSIPQVEMWVTREQDFFSPNFNSVGHLSTTGGIYSKNIQSLTIDTIRNWMNDLGVTTSGSILVDRYEYIKNSYSDIFLVTPTVEIKTGTNGAGSQMTYGTNDKLNTALFGLSDFGGNSNWGAHWMYDNNGTAKAGMEVNPFSNQGIIWANIKNFRMDHPKDPSKEIWYASLEGPEAAAYVRGTATLQNGEAFVPFPEHFSLVANPQTLTVILTPMSADTYGLSVIEKSAEGIRVKELKGGEGNFSFDWEVKGVRQGFEDYQTVREKSKDGPVLPAADRKIQQPGSGKPQMEQLIPNRKD